MNDVRFSSAIHMLVMVSESNEPLPSVRLAESIGTNASYVRKIASSLQRAGIIEGRRGSSGYKLVRPASDITLLDVYEAVCETKDVAVFDLHQNPNDACIVGRHIRPVLQHVFSGISQAAARELASCRLSDCIGELAREIEDSDDAEDLAALKGAKL
ncbi:MAG: Rrf2 family transcriptional regulator [Eggerthellaceae bacterium]|nr:Rrf2 family transcriptional regulator [Eggerthellaceae bacterium]